MTDVFEPPLPLYGLAADWPGERRRRSGGGRGGSELLDIWSGSHEAPGTRGAVVVCAQRRAIHGGPAAGSPRATGPAHLIRYDAAFELILSAHEDELASLRLAGETSAMRRLTYELDGTARRIGHDAGSWRPAQLTIDGRAVDAIGITYDGWWLVLYIGIGELADVYVFGPPGTRPAPLELQSVTEAAYT